MINYENEKEHFNIKELPCNERPYEKVLLYGEKVLTDTELIAVLLKSGTANKNSIELARDITKMPDGSYSILGICRKSCKDLMNISGIGEVKAITLKCVAEIARRISITGYNTNFKVDKPEVLADYYMEQLRHLSEERVIAVYLNGNNCFINDKIISTGTVNQSIISPREIFINALNCGAVYVIMIHNHPSGDPRPSSNDIYATKSLVEAGDLLGIKVLDHLIIGDKKFVSLKNCEII